MKRPLTNREWEVAELTSFGLTEKEISCHMDIAYPTVKTHKKNLFNKTGCRNAADVTRWFIQETSGIRIEPKEAIKKLVSSFMLMLVMISEFSSDEFVRLRVRGKAPVSRVVRARVRARRTRETFQFQLV